MNPLDVTCMGVEQTKQTKTHKQNRYICTHITTAVIVCDAVFNDILVVKMLTSTEAICFIIAALELLYN